LIHRLKAGGINDFKNLLHIIIINMFPSLVFETTLGTTGILDNFSSFKNIDIHNLVVIS